MVLYCTTWAATDVSRNYIVVTLLPDVILCLLLPHHVFLSSFLNSKELVFPNWYFTEHSSLLDDLTFLSSFLFRACQLRFPAPAQAGRGVWLSWILQPEASEAQVSACLTPSGKSMAHGVCPCGVTITRIRRLPVNGVRGNEGILVRFRPTLASSGQIQHT